MNMNLSNSSQADTESQKDGKGEQEDISNMALLDQFKDKVNNVKKDYDSSDLKQLSLDALKFLQKPSVIVALLLSFILMSMSMNYGRLEKEVIEME